MRGRQAMATVFPQSIRHHPLAQGLDAQAEAMPRRQFLRLASMREPPSDRSISTRSRVSSRSLIRITIIARHPKHRDDSLSQ
jgi:hypothetical protein